MYFKLEEMACGSALGVFVVFVVFFYYVVKTWLCVTHEVTCWGGFMKFPFSRVFLEVIFGATCSGLK